MGKGGISMNRKSRAPAIILGAGVLALFLLLLFGQLMADEGEKEAKAEKTKKAAPEFTYLGAKKCKMCHSKEKSGAQYKVWEKNRHSKAFVTLQTAEADSIAKAKGLEAAAAEAPECLVCHVTAYGEPAEVRGEKLGFEEGVGCEACHGPGSAYYKMTTMKKLYAGEIEPETVGLAEPNEKLCQTCHNEKSPTYKPFEFKSFAAKIAHPVPTEEEEEEEEG
jgi:hypothetical protein